MGKLIPYTLVADDVRECAFSYDRSETRITVERFVKLWHGYSYLSVDIAEHNFDYGLGLCLFGRY